jgi:ABC-type branched-subunit amino acid transport system ATPase component
MSTEAVGAPRESVLVVEAVTAGYGGPPIVNAVSMTVRAGAITAIVGPNGAGKSTLLKAIAGVLTVSSGRVLLKGTNVVGLPADQLVRAGLSFVPQVANIFPSLTVAENLAMGAYVRRSGTAERAAELVQMFPDLKAAWKRSARTLSGGQRTMLAMARALMLDPSVLMLDEPIAGLSPRLEEVVWEHIETIAKTGVGVLVVEQNTRRALLHSDHGYVMVDGRNRLEGTGEDLMNDPHIADLYIGRA